MDALRVAEFFAYARERYGILLKRKGGAPPPWTQDPALAAWSFCNVFREDDRTTIWFRENIRGPLRHSTRVLFATIAFRWFNRIATGEKIKYLLLEGVFDPAEYKRLVLTSDEPVFTGSYMIRSPRGVPKVDGVLQSMAKAHAAVPVLLAEGWRTLQDAHRSLWRLEGLGPFMSYEVVTDLRHTVLLEEAADINTWASAGPGARRGLSRLIYGNVDQRKELGSIASPQAQANMCALMAQLLAESRKPEHWPAAWPVWEMREVEHTLCEYDKWKRAHEGGSLRRRKFARGSR